VYDGSIAITTSQPGKMVGRKWKVAKAVLKVAVTGKAKNKQASLDEPARGKKSKRKETDESSSSSSDGSSYYSSSGDEDDSSYESDSSEYTSGSSSSEDEDDSGGKKSQAQIKRMESKPSAAAAVSANGQVKLATLPDDSDSDSSVSYGCGTYHRRESLSSYSSSEEEDNESATSNGSSYGSGGSQSGSGGSSSGSGSSSSGEESDASGEESDDRATPQAVSNKSMSSNDPNGVERDRAKEEERLQELQNGSSNNDESNANRRKERPPSEQAPMETNKAETSSEAQQNKKVGDGQGRQRRLSNAAASDLSQSFLSQQLADANSNLRESLTSDNDDKNGETPAKPIGESPSSRFASMMAGLKSSSNIDEDAQGGQEKDGDTDEESLFEAPKIVMQRGESVRSLDTSETKDSNSSGSSGIENGKKIDLNGSANMDPPGVANGNDIKSSSSRFKLDQNEYEEDGKSSNTASAGDEKPDDNYQQQEFDPQNGYQNDHYGDDDHDSYDDEDMMTEDDYYPEETMSILTPIAEGESAEESDFDESSQSASDSEKDIGLQNMSIFTGPPLEVGGGVSKEEDLMVARQESIRASIEETMSRIKSNNPDLTHVRLDNCDMDNVDAIRLLGLIGTNDHITDVSLAHNKLGDESAVALAKLLSSGTYKPLGDINLSGNLIGNKGVLVLKRSIKRATDGNSGSKGVTINTIDLSNNLADQHVMDGLHVPCITCALPSPGQQEHNQRAGLSSSFAKADVASSIPSCNYDMGVALKDEETQSQFRKKLISSRKKKRGNAATLLSDTIASGCLESGWRLRPAREAENSMDTCTVMTIDKGSCAIDRHGIALSGDVHKKELCSNLSMDGIHDDLNKSLVKLSQVSITGELVRLSGLDDILDDMAQKHRTWASSLTKLDPRWQIRKFFNDMSAFGSVLADVQGSPHKRGNGSVGSQAIFTVWRPTSTDAMSKMMSGDGVGKGIEVKGKSAKTGCLSGYVPFLQIHEDRHKDKVRIPPKSDRTRIFFKTEKARDEVREYLECISKDMSSMVSRAENALEKSKLESHPNEVFSAEVNLTSIASKYEVDDPRIGMGDEYAPVTYRLDAPCRVLWEGLVVRKNISRPTGSRFDTGRASQPAFQDMNFAALQHHREVESDPLPVLYQYSDEDPFDARMLLMAYEEEGKVTSVVSDFDCFLIGSRNFSYEAPMSREQLELVDWCVSQLEWILETHTEPESWTTRWLEILKYAAQNGFHPSMPRFGFGDPTSYSMIEASVLRSTKTCGAVRHGPECFNYFFPQELDEKFLIIFPGNEVWRYVSERELREILLDKIREGFAFPLNPKWLLCDPGWITLFRELLSSKHASVKDSLDKWFPPESGLRERILDISRRFPDCFLDKNKEGESAVAEAEEKYKRYLILRRAKLKLKAVARLNSLLDAP